MVRENSKLIRFFSDEYSHKDLEATREFCRAANNNCFVIRAVSADEADDDGDFRVTFEYELLLYPDGVISAKTIIKVAREVARYIANAIKEYDSDSIFKCN